MHITIYVFGAAVALPGLCLGAPIKPVPSHLIQRTETMSLGGSLRGGSVIGRDHDATQMASVETKRASDEPEVAIVIRRDSETDAVPAQPGVLI